MSGAEATWDDGRRSAQADRMRSRSITHGLSGTPEYKIYKGIIKRTENVRAQNYKHYGGRGIKMSPLWRHDFPRFLRDVGKRPTSKHTIERIDNNRGYEPGNVRWAPHVDQVRNTRRNVIITAFGKTQLLVDWGAERPHLGEKLIGERLINGWSPEDALTLPKYAKPKVNVFITVGGITKTQADWARDRGLTPTTISGRLKRGLTPEQAIATDRSRKK
jgi:hypothetical protein